MRHPCGWRRYRCAAGSVADVDELLAWLTGVLDVLERGQDGPMDCTWMARRDSDRARAQAERAIVRVHSKRSFYSALSTQTLRQLAHGHRFDAPGYQDSWAPPS